MRKKIAFAGAILSCIPFAQQLFIKTGFVLVSIGLILSFPEKVNAGNAKLYFDSGNDKHNAGYYYGAIADYNKTIEIDPNFANAYVSRCSAKSFLGMYKEALKDCEKALNLNKNDSSFYVDKEALFTNLCGVKVNLRKDYYGAISDCNKSILLNSKDSLPYRNRGIAKEEIGDMNGACNDWRRASEFGDKDAKEWFRDQC